MEKHEFILYARARNAYLRHEHQSIVQQPSEALSEVDYRPSGHTRITLNNINGVIAVYKFYDNTGRLVRQKD